MAAIGMSLEEIIKTAKKSKGGRNVGGFRGDKVQQKARSGGARNFGKFSQRAPEGRWKHDMYEGAGGKRGASASTGGAVAFPHKPVRVTLSSLAPTVTSADLEELFTAYNATSAAVHYDENGASRGTGDVVLKKKDALDMIRDYKGVALDGYKMRMALVDSGNNGGSSIQSRLQFKSPRQNGGGIAKRGATNARVGRLGGVKKVVSGKVAKKVAAKAGKPKREKKVPKTEAELDAELEEYMSKKGAEAME